MRSLHQRGRETNKFHILSSSCLCLRGWGSSSLEIFQVCSEANQAPPSWGLIFPKVSAEIFWKGSEQGEPLWRGSRREMGYYPFSITNSEIKLSSIAHSTG